MRSKGWWQTLLGMLMQQCLVRSEARQGTKGTFSAVQLTPEVRPGPAPAHAEGMTVDAVPVARQSPALFQCVILPYLLSIYST